MKGKGKAKGKRQYKTKCPPLDRISNLPSSIIENILCLVPIQDAVRTSILSKDWRYNWTKIPKLVFDLDQLSVMVKLFEDWSSERKKLMRRCKQFFAIYQVLLRHEGRILEFSFSMSKDDIFNDECVELEQMIILLSRSSNTVKKFTFEIITGDFDYIQYELPRSVFLLRHLTYLCINNCTLELDSTFDGFGSLTILDFCSVRISESALSHLLANCPKLEILCLDVDLEGDWVEVEYLFKCLPVIKNLSIDQSLIRDPLFPDLPPKLSSALAHLQCFLLHLDDYGLEFLFLVIRSSPNLETLRLHIDKHKYFDFVMSEDSEIGSGSLEQCSDIWLEHLNVLEIRCFYNLQHEMEFVKLIVAKTPMLMRVEIFVYGSSISKDEVSEIERTILGFPRVSQFALCRNRC